MRVISGTARGRKLFALEGMSVRPTTDKVKESLFNIIQFDIQNSKVLDLFAGSGQLGIEALSRGAEHCVFVDSSKRSLEIIRKNIGLARFSECSDVYDSDSFVFLGSCKEKFDILFLDPPYGKQLCDKAFELLPRVLKKTSCVICETRADEVLPDHVGELKLYREYNYSSVKLSVYRADECESE